MQKTFALRKFTLNDLQHVMHINRVCLPENYTDFFFIDLHRRFPETFIVAEENGEIVGYIMCRIEFGLSDFGFSGLIKKGHIVSVAVMPEHRRKGIGQALIADALNGMRSYGAKQCFLEVRVTNDPAINLYTKLGFKVTRTIRGYYADGEDAYVMSKEIPKKSSS
ncbi:MAG: ribosomal protein S18-alanine N-acetyltransferase [Candidatus Bathyarchaeia archaeon]|nr:MAG: ribosomal-protein-alanine N-acetyltransferase [Candidatus Bathyarchaeota archaeon]